MRSHSFYLLSIFGGVLLSLFLSGEARAQESEIEAGSVCYVSKFKFDNQGAYALDRFKVGTYEYDGSLSQGQTRTWKLSKANVSPGDVVFLRYQIDQGNNLSWKTCKKDGTTLKYHPSGNTWTYWSRGTARFNNRCRFRNNTCIKSVRD